MPTVYSGARGDVAQLGEHRVRIAGVRGSSPLISTIPPDGESSCQGDVRRGRQVRAKLLSFGSIEVEGQRYDHDVVIDRGEVRKRHKGPSKALRAGYGHTPLSAAE